MDILELAEKALEKRLCDHCLGRLFAKRGHGLSNKERGLSLRLALISAKKQEESQFRQEKIATLEKCWLCENLFTELEKFANLIVEKLKEYDYETFLIGSRVDPEITEREEVLWGEISSELCEPIKGEINREVGKLVGAKVGKNVDFDHPDIVAVIDTNYDTVELQISSLFIYGRYRKLQRGIPQTKWPCKTCRGKGCEKCAQTGKMYETSVEEIIAEEVMRKAKGEAHEFHGMGREDIDAVMSGNGRPFILEIKRPVKRETDLTELEKQINRFAKDKVEVEGLRFSSKGEVVAIKAAKPPKTYEVEVEFEEPIEQSKLEGVCTALRGVIIQQKTPKRVAHRRAKKVRERKILEIEAIPLETKKAVFKITSESGTYIKELIHGDEGRTQPNISEMLRTECKILSLDVIYIHDQVDYNIGNI